MRSRYEWVETSIAFRPILSFLYKAFFVGLPGLTSASRFGDEIWGRVKPECRPKSYSGRKRSICLPLPAVMCADWRFAS